MGPSIRTDDDRDARDVDRGQSADVAEPGNVALERPDQGSHEPGALSIVTRRTCPLLTGRWV